MLCCLALCWHKKQLINSLFHINWGMFWMQLLLTFRFFFFSGKLCLLDRNFSKKSFLTHKWNHMRFRKLSNVKIFLLHFFSVKKIYFSSAKVRDRNAQDYFRLKAYTLDSQNRIVLSVTRRLESKISLRLVYGSIFTSHVYPWVG